MALPLPRPQAPPCITRAAALLFSRQTTKYVPGAAVHLVRLAGVGPSPGATKVRKEHIGPRPYAARIRPQFVLEQTSHDEVAVGPRRERLSEYPEAVLREAVLNALLIGTKGLLGGHRRRQGVGRPDRDRSPGPLQGHITLENIGEEHYSRNRRVMQVLKLLGFVEEHGEGVDRMYGEMEGTPHGAPRVHHRLRGSLDNSIFL